MGVMSTPNPSHFPSYRKPSEKEGPSFNDSAHRAQSSSAFRAGASTYDEVRPHYPDEVYELLTPGAKVLDCGAGTGKFTEGLVSRGFPTLACDPSADMVNVLSSKIEIPVWRAIAENTALKPHSVDAVSCAQTWHWVDTHQACAEADRVIKAGGTLLLAWNTLDVQKDPWILRLARIMHSGDIQRPGFYPQVTSPWKLSSELRLHWSHMLTPHQLHLLMHTRAYWLRNGQSIRERMTGNLNWYLFEHMGFTEDQQIEIPYRTDAFAYRR